MTGQEKTKNRKKDILIAATEIFAEKGFQGTTISEIGRKARISEASIYEYYSTKENILFSIPYGPIKKLGDNIEYHLKLIKGEANKLYAFIKMQLTFYNDNPDFASVLLLVLKQKRRFLNTESHRAIREYIKIFNNIISNGMKNGEFRSDINLDYVSSFLIGALEHVVTNWIMVKQPENLLDAAEVLFDAGLRLLKKENNSINLQLR